VRFCSRILGVKRHFCVARNCPKPNFLPPYPTFPEPNKLLFSTASKFSADCNANCISPTAVLAKCELSQKLFNLEFICLKSNKQTSRVAETENREVRLKIQDTRYKNRDEKSTDGETSTS